MIEFLSGKIIRRLPTGVVLDVVGVGYGVTLTVPAVIALPKENQAKLDLWIYTKVKEDELSLYGFISYEERCVFAILVGISGIGPKVAMAILSTLSIGSLKMAVEDRRPEVLYSVPGIGKRTAQKVLLELQNKVDRFPSELVTNQQLPDGEPKSLFSSAEEEALIPRAIASDVKSALANLGFKEKDTERVLRGIEPSYKGEDFSTILKKALALLGKKQKVNKSNTLHDSQPKEFDRIF